MEYFNTSVGNPAEGESYLVREYLDQRFWQYIERNSNILISAPRRVGKTSFLVNSSDFQPEGFLIKYHNTESVNSSNEFFGRLYKSVLEELSSSTKLWEGMAELRKRNQIEKIGVDGIKLNKTDLNYYEEFGRLIREMNFEKTLIFIIDEFSETVENIINDQEEGAGPIFLHQNRELRQNREVNSKIQFVYSGSIGLGNIAERVGAVKSINDLTDFPIPPLSNKEALAMIEQVTTAPELQFNDDVKEHLLKRIDWLMPYYIQIILDEVETLLLRMGNAMVVDKEIIDQAIKEALDKRNYFEHWHTRLRTALKGKEYSFAKEVLNVASKSKTGITKTKVFDLAEKYGLKEDYNIIIRTLEYDGYLSLNDKKTYVFNSPLLKIWWATNIAI